MKISLLSSVLLLGAATAKRPEVFGRSMRQRSSPLKRIRSAGIDAAKAAKKEVSGESLLAKTTKPPMKSLPSADSIGEASRSKKPSPSADTADDSSKGRRSRRSAKTTKLFKKPAFAGGSPDGDGESFRSPKASKKFVPAPKASKKLPSSESYDESMVRSPKASKKLFVDGLENISMSYDLASSFSFDFSFGGDFDSSFSYDFGTSADNVFVVDRPTAAAPATVAVISSIDSSDDISTDPGYDTGRIIFEYLSQCAGLPLDVDSCLVSNTIDIFMTLDDADEGMNGRRRLHQASNGKVRFLDHTGEAEDECGRPEVEEQDVRAIMSVAKEQCEAAGVVVPDGEFNEVLGTFMRLFANQDCWEALCDEVITSELFYKIIFDDASKCANGEVLPVHECLKDQLVQYILYAPDLEPDECDTPSEADLAFFSSFMLTEAQAQCNAMGIDIDSDSTDWREVTYDLVNIFASTYCWGLGDCEEYSSADYSWATEPPVFEENVLVIADGGSRCIYVSDSDPELQRSLVIPFFYQVETASSDQPSLQGIEEALIALACDDSSDVRRNRMLSEYHDEPLVVAVDSSPYDILSTQHTCSAENPEASSCFVVEGKVTVIVEGDSTFDDEVMFGSYEALEQLFAILPSTIDDPNIVDVAYIGKEMRSTRPTIEDTPDIISNDSELATTLTDKDVPEDEPTVDNLNQELDDDTGAYTALLIATSGGLVAMAMLISGFHRMNKEKGVTDDSIQPDEKSNGSNDGQSTAYDTADLTYANSCDRSDASSLPSPARSFGLPSPAGSLGGALSPASHRVPEATKFFVLAEEEEENWRELSILPDMTNDDGTLEGVSEEEEGSFVSATSSDSEENGEMSV